MLCIDLDPQGNLTMSQGIDPDKVEKSLYDVLVNDMPISEIIQQREIDIAVASIDLAGAEIAMSTKIGRERSLEKALKEVAGDYDFVCIDTPPSLGLLTINALTAANKVIVPVQCEYLSMRGLVQLQNTLKMIQENLNPDVRIEGILPTMLDTRTVHAKEAVEILEENFGDLVFKSRIRKAIKFAEAPVKGASVLKYDSGSNAANYYRELAKEVLANGSANKRASMREGPLADLFRSTSDDAPADPPEAPGYGREDPAEASEAAGRASRRYGREDPRRGAERAERGRGRAPAPEPESEPSRAASSTEGQRRDAARAPEAGLLRGAAAAQRREIEPIVETRATGARSPPTSRPAAASRTSR